MKDRRTTRFSCLRGRRHIIKGSHKKLAATSAGVLCFNVIHLVLLVTISVFCRNLSELCVFSFQNSRVNLISI